MSEAKENFAAGDPLNDTGDYNINQISKNANDGGGFRDDLNAGETIAGATLPVAVYIDQADGEIKACDGNDATKLNFIGFAISTSSDGNPISIQTSGIIRGFSGLTSGAKYYVQDDKTIGTAIGTYEVLVGIAVGAGEILIQKKELYNCIVGSRVKNAAAGDISYTHNLGVLPKKIKITALAGNYGEYGESVGIWNNGSHKSIYKVGSGGGECVPTSSTTYLIYLTPNDGTKYQRAIYKEATATTFTLTWTMDTGPAVDAVLLIEVWG